MRCPATVLTSVGTGSHDAQAAALRAACELLTASAAVTAVSVSARWHDADRPTPSLLRVAERLASTHDLAVFVRLDRSGFDIRFERRGLPDGAPPDGGRPEELGA
ncbi:MAG: hypothetical protein ACRDGJ_11050 [Candidatus Limnocylindria bacterium]